MFLSVLVIALMCSANAEFIQTANKQIKQGYEWSYVGKTKPLEFQRLQSSHNLVMSISYLN